jgi:S1-C subfamily serine protease
MKTLGTIAIAVALVLLPWCSVRLFAQTAYSRPVPEPAREKKIIITKRSVDANGAVHSETIIKRGKAAEKFDVGKYVLEQQHNHSDQQIEVRVDDGTAHAQTFTLPGTTFSVGKCQEFKADGDVALCATTAPRSSFLGIDQDSDEDPAVAGLTVQVVCGSAAAGAGLKTNDVLLKISDRELNTWSDVGQALKATKPGDPVKLTYLRNGKKQTAMATLTTRDAVQCEKQGKGFLGVTTDNEAGTEEGVRVTIVENSAAARAGLQSGDVLVKLNDTRIRDYEDITDFMAETQPNDKVRVTYLHNGEKMTTEAVLGQQKAFDYQNFSNGNFNNTATDWSVAVRSKEACLGVYTQSKALAGQTGAEIIDFPAPSAAQEVRLGVGDVITSVNGQRVRSHEDLWNEISKYKVAEKIVVEYLRGEQPARVEATLKACEDRDNEVTIVNNDEDGDSEGRQFYLYDFDEEDQELLRERQVITIHKSAEGDGEKIEPEPAVPADRKLALDDFRAFPNPTQGQITVEFHAEPVATLVSLHDLAGRQLFREELNAFNGAYNQQFDLSEYAKGTIMIRVQQGDRIFTRKIVVN